MRNFRVSVLTVFIVLTGLVLLTCDKDTLDKANEASSKPSDADFVMITPFGNPLKYATTLALPCDAISDKISH